MRRVFAPIVILVASCSPATGEIDRTVRIEIEGVRRSFDLFVPAGLSGPTPLVIVFHGLGGTADGVRRLSGFDSVAREQGFAVAYPQATGLIATWRAAPTLGEADVRFVAALIDEAAAITAIDRRAVFVAGMSNGGGMAARVGCERPDLVAGVGSVAGAHAVPLCLPEESVALMAFHGTSDRIVPYDGTGGALPAVQRWAGGWAEADGCGPAADTRIADDVVATTWVGCDAPVVLLTVEGGRHGWPGSDRARSIGDSTVLVSASKMLGDFFTAVRAGSVYAPAP